MHKNKDPELTSAYHRHADICSPSPFADNFGNVALTRRTAAD